MDPVVVDVPDPVGWTWYVTLVVSLAVLAALTIVTLFVRPRRWVLIALGIQGVAWILVLVLAQFVPAHAEFDRQRNQAASTAPELLQERAGVQIDTHVPASWVTGMSTSSPEDTLEVEFYHDGDRYAGHLYRENNADGDLTVLLLVPPDLEPVRDEHGEPFDPRR